MEAHIVTAMVLRVNALEPGIMFGTGLHANMPRRRLITMSILATPLRPYPRVAGIAEGAEQKENTVNVTNKRVFSL